MWTWNESGGSPPCMRVLRTALAFEPAAPATAWLTISTPGWLFSKMAYIALRPASSPPVVHQENISSRPPPAGLPAAGAAWVGAGAAGLAASAGLLSAGLGASAGLLSAGLGASAGLLSAGFEGAGVAALPQAASSELAATSPVVPSSVFRKDRRARRCSRAEAIAVPS